MTTATKTKTVKSDKAAKSTSVKTDKAPKKRKEAQAAKPAPVKQPAQVEHVAPLKTAKPYPQGSAIVQVGKKELPIKARVAVVLSVLQAAGEGVPLGKKDLMRAIGKKFSNAPGVNSKEGISSGANGNYNDSVEYLQSLGFCKRMTATEAGIEGGAGKVALLTKEGAAVKIPDACSVK